MKEQADIAQKAGYHRHDDTLPLVVAVRGSAFGHLLDFDSALVGERLPQNLLEPSTANWNLSGQSPSILLRKTVLSLKSPTGAFIVLLRSTNANLYIKENIDETVFMFALFKCRKSDKGRN